MTSVKTKSGGVDAKELQWREVCPETEYILNGGARTPKSPWGVWQLYMLPSSHPNYAEVLKVYAGCIEGQPRVMGSLLSGQWSVSVTKCIPRKCWGLYEFALSSPDQHPNQAGGRLKRYVCYIGKCGGWRMVHQKGEGSKTMPRRSVVAYDMWSRHNKYRNFTGHLSSVMRESLQQGYVIWCRVLSMQRYTQSNEYSVDRDPVSIENQYLETRDYAWNQNPKRDVWIHHLQRHALDRPERTQSPQKALAVPDATTAPDAATRGDSKTARPPELVLDASVTQLIAANFFIELPVSPSPSSSAGAEQASAKRALERNAEFETWLMSLTIAQARQALRVLRHELTLPK